MALMQAAKDAASSASKYASDTAGAAKGAAGSAAQYAADTAGAAKDTAKGAAGSAAQTASDTAAAAKVTKIENRKDSPSRVTLLTKLEQG